MPLQPLDDIFQILKITAPTKGLMDGFDPALPDEEYPPGFSPDLENLRIVGGRWETRKGMTLWQAMPGSGDIRWLETLYQSSGAKIRLCARGTGTGATLYKLLEGTDTAFTAVTGGTGLGGTTYPLFNGTINQDQFYLTDRQNGLFRYNPSPASGNQLVLVAQPAVPAAAPRVRTRWFDKLDDWSNLGAWTISNAAKYNLTAAATSLTPPGGGNIAQISILTTDANGQTISRDVSNQSLNSHTIAFWVNPHVAKFYNQFGFGIGGPDEYPTPLPGNGAANDEWTPVFIPVGDVPSINFKRFSCVNAQAAPSSIWVSQIYLPGNLDGAYRWRYTHYDPVSGRESPPSAVSSGGQPLDLSVNGITGNKDTNRAFQKCALLDFTSDSGTDATTTKIRVYRSGGVPWLTQDQNTHTDIWLRVGEVFDQATTVNNFGGYAAGVTSMIVTSAANLAVGDTLIFDKGSATEEYLTVKTVVGTTLTFTFASAYAHANGASLQVAFIDNVANETIDVTARIDVERDNPPTGGLFVSRAPDGRLWVFGYNGHPTGVAVSNKPTPDKPHDYEVFPNGVDPLTRRSPIQGWRFDIGGDVNDDAIVWGGFFRGRPTVITKRNIYIIEARSQADWGNMSIQKVFNIGCLAPESVREVNGVLYWVAPGPRIMRWTGIQRYSIFDLPEVVSHLRANIRLQNAPTAYWNQWIGAHHVKTYGQYYCLYFTPQGQTKNTQRLDYNAEADVFEPQVYYDASGAPIAWAAAHTREGGSDFWELYQVTTSGQIYQADVGTLDAGLPIAIRGATKKFPLEMLSQIHTAWLRLAGVTDTLTLTVTVGGGEYPQQSQSYALSLAGSGDTEIKKRVDRGLKGRWVQVQLSGSMANGAAVRDLALWVVPIRAGAVHF